MFTGLVNFGANFIAGWVGLVLVGLFVVSAINYVL